MNAQILTFSANEQTLIKTGGIDDFASNTVRYAKATFTLGTNWTGFDSVRAVWKTACYTISTVLDANHSCDVPPEVLSYKAKVYVNLVGSISENGVLTDRLTTFPVLAMHIKSNAPVEGTETAPVTASQFEQFVETVQDAADSISDYSYDSEAWAVGKRGGVDVPSTDETYHNNSKYWAEQNAGLSDEVADLKSEISDIETILEIPPEIKDTKTVSGSVKIIDNIEFKAGYTYTVKFSIPSAIASATYVYWKKSDDTTYASGAISAGSTSKTITYTMSDTFTGYLSAINNSDSVDVTAEVTSDEPQINAIDRIDADIQTLDNLDNTEVAYGYNIKAESGVETGAGAYYWQSGAVYKNTSGSYGTDYTYYIFPVKKNSVYSASVAPRWIILVDKDGNKVSDTVTGKMIKTGNAVKMYFTLYNTQLAQFAISEGYLANLSDKLVLSIAPQMESHHGNSLPMDTLYFSVGIAEKMYYNNMLALDSDRVALVTACDQQDTHDETGVTITPVSASSNSVGVRIKQYDSDLNLIYEPCYTGIAIKAMNLQNCTALVIGDSTVGSWGTMTQQMLDKFAELGKTLTLLGTRGSGANKHEGRGGWSAKAYCTEASHGDYTNPFLNDGAFDFSYYMTQQGYSSPDFVIIQLGINDVSNTEITDFKTISEQSLSYEKEMIDSIRAYDSNIKILVSPPTTPSADQSALSMYYETTVFRNEVIRYAMMLRRLVTQYDNSKVRCSNNNLILDSATEIRDNVHPTEAGFIKLGNEAVSQINCWQN